MRIVPHAEMARITEAMPKQAASRAAAHLASPLDSTARRGANMEMGVGGRKGAQIWSTLLPKTDDGDAIMAVYERTVAIMDGPRVQSDAFGLQAVPCPSAVGQQTSTTMY